jgi:hypothetical protein
VVKEHGARRKDADAGQGVDIPDLFWRSQTHRCGSRRPKPTALTNPDVFYSQPGARLLATDGTHDDVLAFANLDGSTAIIVRNEAKRERIVNIAVAGTTIPIVMQLDSINTLVVKPQSA